MTAETAESLRYAAFTDHGRGGNPANVVLDAAIRYFSPQHEVAFCGHATIAAAVAVTGTSTRLDG